jgi:hypothetical protein
VLFSNAPQAHHKTKAYLNKKYYNHYTGKSILFVPIFGALENSTLPKR